MPDLDMFLVQIDDLWVNPEDIIAIRANESGETSTIYCSDAHLFRVRLKPEEIIALIEGAIAPSANPPPVQPFLYGHGVGLPSQPYTFQTNPIVNP